MVSWSNHLSSKTGDVKESTGMSTD